MPESEVAGFLKALHPNEGEDRINQAVQFLLDGCRRWDLRLNKLLCRNGVTATRLARAIFEQMMETKFQGDCNHILAAITLAEQQTELVIDPNAHPTLQRQERDFWLDTSQVKWGQGSLLFQAELATK
jgi:hypothetical protein